MRIIIDVTAELFQAVVNGATIPLRVWTGHTERGIPVDAYVLAITPGNAEDHQRLRAEMPSFMRPARDAFTIDLPASPEPIHV